MADILEELEGILGADVVATLRSNPYAVTKLKARDDIYEYYMGEHDNAPADPPKPTVEPTRTAPPRVATGAPNSELSAIMAKLDSIGDVDAKIKTGVEAVVTARGNELVNNAIAISMRNSRELSKLDVRNQSELGSALDDDALSAHADAAAKAGRPFRTITDAWEDMTRQARFDKQLREATAKVEADAKTARASGDVPGVSPTAATPMLRVLKNEGRKPGEADSHLSKATEAFAKLRTSREGAVA